MAEVDYQQSGSGVAEEQYRRLVENCPDAICVHKGLEIKYVNAAAVRWMRATSRDQLVGMMITDLIAPESVPALMDRMRALREIGDTSEPAITRMRRLDGTVLDVEALGVLTLWDGEPAYEVMCRDVTTQQAAAALQYQMELVRHVSDAIIAINKTGHVTSWNTAAEDIYGRSADEVIGMPVVEAVGAVAEPGPPPLTAAGGVATATHRSADGTSLDVRVSMAPTDNGYILVCSDLTALRRAERHFEVVVDMLDEGIVVIDRNGTIKSINPAASRIIGISARHLGADFFSRTAQFPVFDEDGFAMPVEQRPGFKVMQTGAAYTGVVLRIGELGGQTRWLRSSGRLLNPDRPDESDLLISFTDITAEREAAERLEHQATHDPLTGLPNRAFVLGRIAQALGSTDGDRLRAVVYIDLDNLKSTNDSLGHEAGDELLCATAERLRGAVAGGDVVGRLGGDEFVVLLFNSQGEVGETVERLKGHLEAPVTVASTSSAIRASIGMVSVSASDQRTAEEILRDADLAMYEAKRAGRRRRDSEAGAGRR